MNEGRGKLGRSGIASSCEANSVIVFSGRAFWCRKLWAAGGADLIRSLSGGRLLEPGEDEETECLEVLGASPYDRIFFDFLKSILTFTTI